MDTLVALGSSVFLLWSLAVFYDITFLTAHGTPFEELHHMYMHDLYFETGYHDPFLITLGKMLEAMSRAGPPMP